MFTKAFWKAAAERAVKTGAQFGLTAWGVATFTAVGQVVPAAEATGLAVLFGAVLSVLTSLGSDAVTSQDGPSLTNAEVLPEPGAHEGD